MSDARSPSARPSNPTAPAPVRHRHVFYIPGYDPMVPRRYRELYRTEAAQQAAISGYELQLSALPAQADNYAWQVAARIDGVETHSVFEFLQWGDIVRASMRRSVAGVYWVMARTFWLYLSTGALSALFRLRLAPMIAALYPAVMLIVQAMIAAGLGALVIRYLPGPALLGWLAGAGLAVSTLLAFRALDRRVFIYYLMHDYAFSTQLRGATPPEMLAREAAFAARVAQVLASDVDEVLIVGHSSGAHHGVALIAQLLRDGVVGPHPRLGFLTLGAVIPMLSFLPEAQTLRRDLNLLARSPEITWIDITAPGDGACFALADPVSVSGVAPPEGEKLWPKLISAAFSHTMSKAFLRRTRLKFFRRHFQYLCAFERPRDYDYFKITAGPLSLRDRFAARGPSRSRIETVLSPYRDF